MKINRKFNKDILKLINELRSSHSFGDNKLDIGLCNGYLVNGYINSYLYNYNNLRYKVILELEFDFKNDIYDFYIDLTSDNIEDDIKFTTVQQFDNIIDMLKFMQKIEYFEWKFSWDYFKDLQ